MITTLDIATPAEPSQRPDLNPEIHARSPCDFQTWVKLPLIYWRVIEAGHQTRAERRSQADHASCTIEFMRGFGRIRKISRPDADIRNRARFFWTSVHISNIHKTQALVRVSNPGRDGWQQ